MRRAGDRPLLLGPAQRVQAERRPVRRSSRRRGSSAPSAAAGTGGRCGASRSRRLRCRSAAGTDSCETLSSLPVKNCNLVVEARPPGQVAADLQVFAQAVAHHVLGVHAFGRVGVVRAAGRVDVMVAGVPAEQRRIDPAFDLVAERRPGSSPTVSVFVSGIDSGPREQMMVYCPAGSFSVLAVGRDRSADEMRSRARAAWPARDRRGSCGSRIEERGRRRLAVFVGHAKRHFVRRRHNRS